VTAVQNGKTFKEIYVTPSGLQGGAEEVLIVLQGVHQEVPARELASPGYRILPLPAEAATEIPQGAPQPGAQGTDADRLRAIYKQAGADQKHVFGEGAPGSKPPDFTKIPSVHGAPPPANAAAPAKSKPKPEGAETTDDEPARVAQPAAPPKPNQ